MLNANDEPLVYDVPTAGRMVGLGQNAAYRAAAAGDIPSIRIGGRVVVPKAKWDRIVAGEEAPSQTK